MFYKIHQILHLLYTESPPPEQRAFYWFKPAFIPRTQASGRRKQVALL